MWQKNCYGANEKSNGNHFPLSVFLCNKLNGQDSGFINAFYTEGTSALRRGFQINKEGDSRKYRIETVSSVGGSDVVYNNSTFCWKARFGKPALTVDLFADMDERGEFVWRPRIFLIWKLTILKLSGRQKQNYLLQRLRAGFLASLT
jgi:hypothetical protein